MAIQFFGAVDRKIDLRTGESKITSEYPAWTMPRQIEIMEEGIAQKKRAMDMGFVDRANTGEHQVIIEREEQRLKEIKESKPKLTDQEKDVCAKVYKEVTGDIQKTMPYYYDMQKGHVDAHEQHRINSQPNIKMSDKACEIAKANGIKVSSNGMVSRNAASKLAKLIGHAIGENTNMERLRKDNRGNR